jgi:hypothetical protein
MRRALKAMTPFRRPAITHVDPDPRLTRRLHSAIDNHFARGCSVQVKSIAGDASIRSILALSHIVNDLADFMNAQAFHVWVARHIVFLDQA